MTDIESLVASVEAFSSAAARDERAKLLAEIRAQIETLGTADETASKGAVAVAEALLRRVISLQRYLIDTFWDDDPEAYALVQQAVEIVTSYVSGYLEARDPLICVDAKQQMAPTAVLSAPPFNGEVDYAELSREHIARYPKIRAALAE